MFVCHKTYPMLPRIPDTKTRYDVLVSENQILIAIIAGVFAANAAVAQPGTYRPICSGLTSVDWCHEFDAGLPSAMTVDANGITYVASNSTVTAIGPNGSVVYTAQFKSAVQSIALGSGGLWVQQGFALFQVDGQGNELPINYAYSGIGLYSVSSDAAGDLYIYGATPSSRDSIIKLSNTAAIVGTFALDAYGSVQAWTTDSSGAVYIVGEPNPGFTGTPGAFETTMPKSAYGISDAYLLKISPTLDKVIYATFLCQGQCSPPTALAVDSQGDAYVGAYFYPVADLSPYPVTQIGVPPESGLSLNVVKMNPQGSALVWSAGLGDGQVDSLATLTDGSVRALVATGNNYDEALFTISPGGDQLETANFLGGVFHPGELLAAGAGLSAPQRALVAVNSARIPVVFDDKSTTPVLVDFAEPSLQADLSLDLKLLQPLVFTNGSSGYATVDVLATVNNNGPADAEALQVQTEVRAPDGGYDDLPFECFSEGAICGVNNGAMIPRLPAGGTMSVEFVYVYLCGSLSCTQWMTGSLFALTSDPDLSNNFATIPLPSTTGFEASLLPPQALSFYRSDAPLLSGLGGNLTADPSLKVWVPPTQTYEGNIWYFDSWADGNRDNPRVFDASNGVPASQGKMNFHTALPFGVQPGSLDLVALPGALPEPQTVKLYPVSQIGRWTVGRPAAAWLGVTVGTANDGTATVTGAASSTGMAPGYYKTTFPATLAVNGLPDATIKVPASLRIMDAPPTIRPGGVVNTASYRVGPLSQLETITILGTGLGPPQGVKAFVPEAGSLPTTLAGTSVEIQNTPLQLLYVQDKEIECIAPNTLYPPPIVVTIELGGVPAASLTIPEPNADFVNPALFTDGAGVNGPGRDSDAATNADGTSNSPRHPAKRGSVVTLYATGYFSTNGLRCYDVNDDFGGLVPTLTPPLEAFIGGEPAYVLYSGSAPGIHCSRQQVRVLVPEDSAVGSAVPIQLGLPWSVDGSAYVWYTTQSGTTIAIE